MGIKELIKAGHLMEGTTLIWKRRVQGLIHSVLVVNEMLRTVDGKLHKTPSGAAKHLNNDKPVDGWKVWRHQISGKTLDDFRKEIQATA